MNEERRKERLEGLEVKWKRKREREKERYKGKKLQKPEIIWMGKHSLRPP